MADMIKVSPDLLNSTASEFSGEGTQVQTLTGQMMELINGLSGVWTGSASEAYLTKFRALDDDMQKMFRMVQEHSKDLQDMAAAYSQAETANAEAAQALSADIIV